MAHPERQSSVGAPLRFAADTSEADCSAVAEAVQGYLVVARPDRRIRFINRAPPGRILHALEGEDFASFVGDEHRSLVVDAMERVLASAQPAELEARAKESGRWYCLRIVAVVDHGASTGFAVHAIDIDDLKRGETERAILRARAHASTSGEKEVTAEEVRRRLDLMADALPVLISYVDAQRRYQFNNAAYERWFGTSREEMRGRDLETVVGSEAYEQIRGYVDAALRGEQVSFEMRIPYKDAGLRQVVAHYVPDLTSTGDVQGFYALIEDVTRQRDAEASLRRREDELRQLQKMEALGRLTGGLAHEFGNLLQTVIAGCTVVLDEVGEETPAGAQLARIQRAAQRGAALTRELLSFSRRDEQEVSPLDLDGLIADMAVLLERIVGPRVRLETELGSKCRILANSGQIQQTLMNLAINARDAMPNGGRLEVRTHPAEITAEDAAHHTALDPGRYAVLMVADTGTGMDEATRARAFEPFFTTKGPSKGTGLGLSTVYGIVKKVGGHIELDSAPGRGTTFLLYFPCASL